MKQKVFIVALDDDSKFLCRSRLDCVEKINNWLENQNTNDYNKLTKNSLDNLIYDRVKNNKYDYITQIYMGNLDKLIKIPNYSISYNHKNNKPYSKSYFDKKLNKERLTIFNELTISDFNLRFMEKCLK